MSMLKKRKRLNQLVDPNNQPERSDSQGFIIIQGQFIHEEANLEGDTVISTATRADGFIAERRH